MHEYFYRPLVSYFCVNKLNSEIKRNENISSLSFCNTVEYTDMAKHARSVMEANDLSDIVTVIQGAVEDVELPIEEDGLTTEDDESSENQVVDIIISEWMGYFLLRESMLDSLIWI